MPPSYSAVSNQRLPKLKAKMGSIQQQMVEAKKNERANALKEEMRLCKDLGFATEMFKFAFAKR